MGCVSSKSVQAAAPAVYRPSPTSFAVFDINTVEEPWLKHDNNNKEDNHEQEKKPAHLPAPPSLQKLQTYEFVSDSPKSWAEVSKALEENLKPTLGHSLVTAAASLPPAHVSFAAAKTQPQPPSKSLSFHTLDELEAKLSSKPTESTAESEKSDSLKEVVGGHVEGAPQPPCSEGFKSLKANPFIVRDRLERGGEKAVTRRRDPLVLSEFLEKCPPGGGDRVVLYTTSLRGVRRTWDNCNRARGVLEGHGVGFDERDVALHGEFRSELRAILGEEGVSVPRLFVKGRYVGGVEEVVGLNESGRLGRLLSWARAEWDVGRRACEGCGGARFVPCLECGGSCKVLGGGDSRKKERCPKCNENGLVLCPACH